jgi:lipopolysaccharide/colanic/teichoic acid biosynthesis glycosyltransferase
MTDALEIQSRRHTTIIGADFRSPPSLIPASNAELQGFLDQTSLGAISCETDTRTYDHLKLLGDCIAGVILLLLSAPLIAVCWVLVRLGSEGPGFYSQTRVGKSGRTFSIYKIRTMYHDVEKKHGGPKWSMCGDSRVTPIGRILRKLHVDELPQLINVIRGEMRLVGPRPERPEFVVPLSREILGYAKRLAVCPGVTGLAQIQLPPDSDLLSVARKLAADLDYIRKRSFWLDFRLLIGTAIYLVGFPYARVRKLAMLPHCEDPVIQNGPVREIDPISWPAKSR